MNYLLVVVICVWGECNSFVTTEPTFKTREACVEYSRTVTSRIQKQLPDSSGSTYCLNDEELKEITEQMLLEEHQQYMNEDSQDI